MYCPGCHKKLDTSLTSCDRCGWQIALGQCIPRAEHDRIVAEKDAEVARLKAERDEALRRRDEWRAKAEGYDAVRLALREKVGTPWPPHMSRLLWAGIAADEKKRADDAASEVARLRAALDAAAIRAMKGERG